MGVLFAWLNDAGDEETWDPAIPSTAGATNNEMELEAPIEALRQIQRGRVPVDLGRFDKIVIRTDSTYVHNNIANAKWTWRRTGWTKKGGASVLHSRTWKALLSEMNAMYSRHHLMVHFEWIPGKKGRLAKMVDELAKRSAKSASFGRVRPNIVARKTTAASVESGSVRIEGQLLTVRIIHAQYLAPPRQGSRYKYEVVEQADPDFGKVDSAESQHDLARGGRYIVRMNDQPLNPRIDEVIQDLAEEQIAACLGALRRVGNPVSAREVATELRVNGIRAEPDSVRRSLEHLVASGHAQRTRSTSSGRPYLYASLPAATTGQPG